MQLKSTGQASSVYTNIFGTYFIEDYVGERIVFLLFTVHGSLFIINFLLMNVLCP